MSLARISRVLLRFHWKDNDSRGVREFWARITSGKLRATNPDCKIDTRVLIHGPPSVGIEYSNKNTTVFNAAGLTAPQILERLQQLADQTETAEVLQKIGVADAQLESSWDMTQNAAGASVKVASQ